MDLERKVFPQTDNSGSSAVSAQERYRKSRLPVCVQTHHVFDRRDASPLGRAGVDVPRRRVNVLASGASALDKVTTFPPPARIVAHDGARVSEPVIVGTGRAMSELRSRANRIASGNAKVLITGESGVGKDVLARFIHAHSPRALRSFIAVNCAGLTETLLESELFGHVRGSFTGAYRDKVGKLRLAHSGTIFLDEVGDMSLCMQALLLRFLENGEVQPVGADAPSTKVDVRVIAATNRDLTSLIAGGQFREDLMYRLNVIHLHVPPLRERLEDVRGLVDHIVAQGERGIAFSEEALQALERYRWPGNVRQLQNVLEQLIWTASGAEVRVDDLPNRCGCPAAAACCRRTNAAASWPTILFRTGLRRLHVLGAHLPAVSESRHEPPRSARADQARPGDDVRELPGRRGALRHAR